MQFDPIITTDGLIYGVAILILIGVTVYYAIQNKRMADELKRQNENAVKPYLVVSRSEIVTSLQSDKRIKPYLFLELINSGNGAALDIRIEATAEVELLGNAEEKSSSWIYKFELSLSRYQKRYILGRESDSYQLEYVGCERILEGSTKGTILNVTCLDALNNEIVFPPQYFENMRYSEPKKEGELWPHEAEYGYQQ